MSRGILFLSNIISRVTILLGPYFHDHVIKNEWKILPYIIHLTDRMHTLHARTIVIFNFTSLGSANDSWLRLIFYYIFFTVYWFGNWRNCEKFQTCIDLLCIDWSWWNVARWVLHQACSTVDVLGSLRLTCLVRFQYIDPCRVWTCHWNFQVSLIIIITRLLILTQWAKSP